MARLKWDEIGKRLFETGVEKVVLYVNSNGVAWNGVSAINESSSGAEANAVYADDIKYLNLISVEEFGLTIEAYMYPDEFKKCLGINAFIPGITIGQQNRKKFDLSYQTLVGNDETGLDHGYKIHLVYGCLASSSENGYNTVNDSPEAMSKSWEINTTPVEVGELKKTALLVIDSKKMQQAGLYNVLKAIERILYGTDDKTPRIIYPNEMLLLIKEQSHLLDDSGNFITDSTGELIKSAVYN